MDSPDAAPHSLDGRLSDIWGARTEYGPGDGWPVRVDQLLVSYELLGGSGGIQSPCNHVHPRGAERLHVDHVFKTFVDECENYGYDFLTGSGHARKGLPCPRDSGACGAPRGPLRAAVEAVREEYPLQLATGRMVYHWHTRTKTGRVAELDRAALGVSERDVVRVESRRGAVVARARVSGIRPGVVFAPVPLRLVGRRWKWLRTKIRNASPQILVAG